RDRINSSNSAASWQWSTGEKTSSILVRYPGTYGARVRLDGCENSDSLVVTESCYIEIPNAFSPGSSNEANAYFLPRQLLSKGVNKFHMAIYNFYGQLIYETTKTDGRGWDGKFNDVAQPQGVYIYTIEAGFADGTNEKYQGNVTL